MASSSNSKQVTAGGGSSLGSYRFDVSFSEQEANALNNTSKINLSASITSVGGGAYASFKCNLKLYWYDDFNNKNGKLIASKAVNSLNSGASSSVTGSITVTHNDEGNLKGYAKLVFERSGSGSYPPNATDLSTSNTTLTAITRKSSIGSLEISSSSNYDSYHRLRSHSFSLKINSSSFTHKLEYSFKEKNGTSHSGILLNNFNKIAGITIGYTDDATAFNNYQFIKFPITINNLQKYENELCDLETYTFGLPITFKLTTYNNDAATGTILEMGTDEKTFVFDINSIAIDFSVLVKANDSLTQSLTGTNNVFIKGISDVYAEINNLVYHNGASVSSYFMQLYDSSTSKYTSFNDNTFKHDFGKIFGIASLSFGLTDSRGFMGDVIYKYIAPDDQVVKKDFLLLNYFSPKISKLNVKRREALSTTIDVSCNGEFWNQKFGSLSTAKTNSITLSYRYKIGDGSWTSFTNVNPTKSGNSFSYSTTISVPTISGVIVEFKVQDLCNEIDTLSEDETKSVSLIDATDGYFNVNGMICQNDELVPCYVKNSDGTFQAKDSQGNNIFFETGLFKKVGTFNGTK